MHSDILETSVDGSVRSFRQIGDHIIDDQAFRGNRSPTPSYARRVSSFGDLSPRSDEAAGRDGARAGRDGHDELVRLSALYKKGSILTAAVAIVSLLSWAMFAAPIVSPFVCVLVIAFAPFAYAMGRSAERG